MALAEQNETLSILNRVAQVTQGALNPEIMCEQLLDVIRDIIPCDSFYIDSFYDEPRKLNAIICFDTIDGKMQQTHLAARTLNENGQVYQTVIKKRLPLLIHRTDPDKESKPFVFFGDKARPSASLLWAPLVVGDRVVGVIAVQSYTFNAYTQKDVDRLMAIARQSGPAVKASFLSAQLRESREILRAAFNSTADGLLVIDSNQKVLATNSQFAKMWNIPPELLEGEVQDDRLLESVFHQLEEPEAFLSKVQELYQTSEESLDELRFKDGKILERFTCPLIRDNQEIGRVWSFRDVTKRKKAEEAERHGIMVSEAIAKASLIYLKTGSMRTMAQMIVEQAVSITGSQFGALVESGQDRESRILAVSEMTWQTIKGQALFESARQKIEKEGFYPLPPVQSLLFIPLVQGIPIMTNDPMHHPNWGGMTARWTPTLAFFSLAFR